MNIENREISVKILESIEELRKSINTISVYDFNIYSSMELYYAIANKLNDVITECNRYEIAISEEIINQNQCLQYLLNDGLMNEVVNKINKMVSDGTMDKVINDNVFNKIISDIRGKADSSALDVERKRIDSLIALPSGSTTGDAELIDSRLGQDGITYSSSGSAIRKQFSKVYNHLLNTKTGEEFLPFDFEIGSYDSSGNKIVNNYRARTINKITAERDYTISCDTGYQVYIRIGTTNTGWVSNYNIKKGNEFILTIKKDVESVITDVFELVSRVRRDSDILDKVKQNKKELNVLESIINKKKLLFSKGYLSASTGEGGSSDTRIVCDFIDIEKVKYILFDEDVNGCVFRYDSAYNFIDNTTGSFTVLEKYLDTSSYKTDSCRYIRILSTNVDNINSINSNSYIVIANEKLSKFNGKKVSIYGDSISTYDGWIPSGNRVYYDGTNCGVDSVYQTWWKKVIDDLGMELVVNNSWSGRCVTTFRDSESGNLNSAGCRDENIVQLKTSTKTPQIIFIKLGVNDFLRFSSSLPFGTYKGLGDVPTDMTSFREAYAMMLDKIKSNFPNADVYCCTVMQCKRDEVGYPNRRNGVTISDLNNAIIEIANLFECKVLRHDLCGINYYNASSTLGDGVLHPNAEGHKLIADYTIYELTKTSL